MIMVVVVCDERTAYDVDMMCVIIGVNHSMNLISYNNNNREIERKKVEGVGAYQGFEE
jgi:hypothetical protein